MASWAELDENNVVINLTIGDNNDPDEGYQWLIDNLGGRWVQTSFHTRGNKHKLGKEPFRKNYAGIGYIYDEERDAFIPPKPFSSWSLDEETCLWEAPILKPNETDIFDWDEENQKWVFLGTPPPPMPTDGMYVWDEPTKAWVKQTV